jgi:hypothetical protein
MRVRLLLASLLACGAGALIAGCGSSTRVVSAKEGSSTGSTQSSASSTKTGSSASTSSSIATVTKTVTATSTRTSSAPAFAKPESGGQALQAAVTTVESQGYTPTDTADYHPEQTLRVLTASRNGSGGSYQQHAFFFVDGRYIGTDASQPSGSLKIVSQTATSVTLAYSLYRSGDSPCCPGGGQSTVRFQLDDGHLQALDPIPPASSTSGLSRL